ncbi:hypothetical protein [Catellatospora vulcania]|uniref:hypothetical protein n=1 Tax=Catellatospora vulcania TaxID=1460450 RepID=UPI0012D46C44|nr:hypothetical protein [Catellatospora vulcania]
MNGSVRHQPRVAFGAATVLADVSAGDAALFAWYGDQLTVLLGPSYRRDLFTRRKELVSAPRDITRDVEAGRWRVRFEDVLRTRPEVVESLHRLTLSARMRLPRSR